MTKPAQVAGFSENGQGDDRADAGDLLEGLEVRGSAQKGFSFRFDRIALAVQAARLRQNHAEHRDGPAVDRNRQPD